MVENKNMQIDVFIVSVIAFHVKRFKLARKKKNVVFCGLFSFFLYIVSFDHAIVCMAARLKRKTCFAIDRPVRFSCVWRGIGIFPFICLVLRDNINQRLALY
jgi:hypothetical protein